MPRTATALAALLLAATAARAAGPYDDLLKHAPENANTLLLVDVQGALASPLAKAEKWGEKGTPDNRGGLGFVPRDATTVVVATEVNLSALTRDFQVGLVKVAGNVPEVKDIAAREGGSIDEIAGRLAVLSPRNAYFTTLSGSEFLAVYPADRQYTARYLKAARANKTGQLTPYLRKATDAAAANTVTIAVDLEDVVDKTILRASLANSPSVIKVKGIDLGLLSSFLSQVKGMTFAAKVTDKIGGSITFEFVGDPSGWKKTLPDLVRELLEGQGVAIPGLENWEAKFTDKTMTLSGPLATGDLKRILSLFAFPGPAGESDPTVKGNEPTVGATKRYMAAVDTVLGDLRSLRESVNYDKMATWHDKAADQLDHLSRQNVDPVASQAAYDAARRLRAIGQSLRGVPIDVNSLASQQYSYTTGGGYSASLGWWGGGFITRNPSYTESNVPQIQAEMAKVIANDKKVRLSTWSEIDRMLQDAKRKLSDKYKADF